MRPLSVASMGLGVFLTLLACSINSLAAIWDKIQSQQHRKTPAIIIIPVDAKRHQLPLVEGYVPIRADLRKSTHSTCSLGPLLWLTGNTLHVGALALAPASLLGPVNSSTLLMTLWLAITLLGEELTPSLLLSTLLTVLGILLCVIASIKPTMSSLVMIGACWTDPLYLSFWLATFLIICFLSVGLVLVRKREIESAMNSFNSQWLDNDSCVTTAFPFKTKSKARPALLALLAGICGSQTVCEIKEISEHIKLLIADTAAAYAPFNCWVLLGAVLLFVTAACCQYPLLSTAINQSDSAILPTAVYQVSWCVFSVIGAGIKFKEYKGYTVSQITLFFTGVLITATATWIASVKM